MSERCGRCNRILRDAISKEKGFGPVCWTKVIGSKERQRGQGRLFKDPELPFSGDIILKRSENGSVLTNIRLGYLDNQAKENLLISIAKIRIMFMATPEGL